MKRVIVVQARVNSTRLPGKVLLDLAGRPMLAQMLRRLKACRHADEIVVATTQLADDDPLVAIAQEADVPIVRGSADDVLARFVMAAKQTKADVIIRVTGDCPLIDPGVTDLVIRELTDHAHECDYASNVIRRTYPRGLDTEAMFVDTLMRIDRLGQSKPAREHVTIVPRSERPELFLLRDVLDAENNADLRWTVDDAADLAWARSLCEELDIASRVAPYAEILAHVRARPHLVMLDTHGKTWTPLPPGEGGRRPGEGALRERLP